MSDMDQLNETIEQFRQNVESMNSAMDSLIRSQTTIINKNSDFSDSMDQFSNSIKTSGNSIDNFSKKTQAAIEEQEKANISKAHYTSAVNSAKMSVAKFTDALISGERGFGVFSGAINGAGDAALELGKSFGTLGTILGSIVKVTTLVIDKQMEQADSVFKARNELFKFAGSASINSNELLDMGQALGFTSKQLDSIINPLKTMGPSLRSLGDTAGEGAKRFLQMAEVEEDTRKKFIRMGVMPEELLESQATYINLQRLAGNQASLRLKTDKQIQEESLKYAESLKFLSDLTVEDAETIKKRQEAALNDFRFQAKITQMNAEAAALEATGNAEDAKRAEEIRATAKNMQDSIAIAAALSPELADQAKSLILTKGAITDFTANLAVAGVDVQKFSRAIESGDPDAILNLLQDVMDKTKDQATRFGDIVRFMTDEQLNALGINRGSMDLVTKYLNTEGQTLTEAIATIREGLEKTGEEGTEPLADSMATLTTTTMKIAVEFDNLLEETNPLIKGFTNTTIAANTLAIAATAAAVALGAMTVGRATRSIFGGENIEDGTSRTRGGRPRARLSGGRIAGLGALGALVSGGLALNEGLEQNRNINEQLSSGEINNQQALEARTTNVTSTTGSIGGAAAGAMAGGVLGTMLIPIPGLGTAIGASLGAYLGEMGGSLLGEYTGEKINEARLRDPEDRNSVGNRRRRRNNMEQIARDMEIPYSPGTDEHREIDPVGYDNYISRLREIEIEQLERLRRSTPATRSSALSRARQLAEDEFRTQFNISELDVTLNTPVLATPALAITPEVDTATNTIPIQLAQTTTPPIQTNNFRPEVLENQDQQTDNVNRNNPIMNLPVAMDTSNKTLEEIMSMVVQRLDDVVYTLQTNNDIQDKILLRSMV